MKVKHSLGFWCIYMKNKYGIQVYTAGGLADISSSTTPFVFFKKISVTGAEIISNGIFELTGDITKQTKFLCFLSCDNHIWQDQVVFASVEVNSANAHPDIFLRFLYSRSLQGNNTFKNNVYNVYIFLFDNLYFKDPPKYGVEIFNEKGQRIYHSGKKLLKVLILNKDIELNKNHACMCQCTLGVEERGYDKTLYAQTRTVMMKIKDGSKYILKGAVGEDFTFESDPSKFPDANFSFNQKGFINQIFIIDTTNYD